ncbi:MAG TPA: glycosyltransferase family 9 protein [Ignavibacteria bacterium]|nr:glycosyltransferase family 9 protein [Ignavibacteria bacterium]
MSFSFSNIKKIIISRTDRIGDVILTLPLVYKIKEIIPESKIYFLCDKYVNDIVTLSNGIDGIIQYKNDLSYLKSEIEKTNADLIINAFPEFKISLAGFLAGVKMRIGTAYRWYSFLYNLRVQEHRKECKLHEYQYNINLLKNFIPEINYDVKYDLKYNSFPELNNFNIPEKFIVLHPTSGGSSIDVSSVTLKKFLSIYNGDEKIIITGSEKDIEINDKLLSGISNKNLINLTGKLSLSMLVSLISKASLVIANSTGPIHIAGMLNIPVVGFYPEQIPMNEKRWGPLSDEKYILRPQNITENEILNVVNLHKNKKQ